jgi:hypothetical protein
MPHEEFWSFGGFRTKISRLRMPLRVRMLDIHVKFPKRHSNFLSGGITTLSLLQPCSAHLGKVESIPNLK